MSGGRRCLVLGIGNILMSDDGVGSMVVREMSDNIPLPDEVILLDGGTLGLDLLQHY